MCRSPRRTIDRSLLGVPDTGILLLGALYHSVEPPLLDICGIRIPSHFLTVQKTSEPGAIWSQTKSGSGKGRYDRPALRTSREYRVKLLLDTEARMHNLFFGFIRLRAEGKHQHTNDGDNGCFFRDAFRGAGPLPRYRRANKNLLGGSHFRTPLRLAEGPITEAQLYELGSG
jgi:hypothetical protein